MASLPPSVTASGSASSSAAGLQQNYGELHSVLSSQLQPGIPQGTVNAEIEKGTSFHEFQTHVDKLFCQHISIEQKLSDVHQQFIELNERRDHHQQILLNSQMHLEHLSNQLQAELSTRETFQIKVQHTSQIVVSLQHHCKSVKDTLLQVTQVYEDLSNQVTQCIESYGNVIEKGKRLQNDDFQERKKLLLAIRDQRLKQQNIYATYSENLKNESTSHHQEMVKLKQKVSQRQLQVKEKELQLACRKETLQKAKENHQKLTLKLNEDNLKLQSIANIQEEKFKKSKTDLAQALEEKANLTAKTRESSQEIKKLADRILTLEEEQNKCIKRKELCIQNTLEMQCKKIKVAKDLEKVCLYNNELKVTINDLRVEKEDASKDGKCEILKIEEMLESYKAEASARAAKLDHETSSAIQDIDIKQKKCENLQELCGVQKDKLQKMKKDHDILKSLNSSIEMQLNEKKAEEQNLSCELQQLAGHISVEKEKKLQVDESLQLLKEQAGNELKALYEETEEIQQRVKIAQEAVQKKNSNVTTLARSLEQVQKDAKVTETSTAEKNAAAIKELQTRLESLVQQKELMIIRSQSLASEQQQELKLRNELLTKQEMEIMEASKISEEIQKDSASQTHDEQILELAIEAKTKLEEELKQTSKHLEDELLQMSRTADGSELTYQEKSTMLETRLKELSELKHKIKELQNIQANALVKSCNENRELQEKIGTTKQNCESLSSDINCLLAEIDSLQKTFALLQKQKENSLQLENDLKKQTSGYNIQIEKKKKELEKLKKIFEKIQKKIRASKRDAAQYKAEHEKYLKAIASAKAKKRQRDAHAISSVIGKENNSPMELQEEQTTPRSILKKETNPKKPPTPVSERKSVSFAAHEDDLPSTSSTIVLEDDMVSEIEKNPAAARSIISKMSDKTRI